MKQWKRDGRRIRLCCFSAVIFFLFSVAGRAAETAAPVQGTVNAPPAGGKVLMLDEAVRIALENHPSIKSAGQQIGAQQAVVGQQMAAYYPTVAFLMTTVYLKIIGGLLLLWLVPRSRTSSCSLNLPEERAF